MSKNQGLVCAITILVVTFAALLHGLISTNEMKTFNINHLFSLAIGLVTLVLFWKTKLKAQSKTVQSIIGFSAFMVSMWLLAMLNTYAFPATVIFMFVCDYTVKSLEDKKSNSVKGASGA